MSSVAQTGAAVSDCSVFMLAMHSCMPTASKHKPDCCLAVSTPAGQDDSRVLGVQFIQEGYTLSYKATKPVAAIQNASCVAFELLGALCPTMPSTAPMPEPSLTQGLLCAAQTAGKAAATTVFLQSAQQSLPWIGAGFPKPLPYTLTSGVCFQSSTAPAAADRAPVVVGSGATKYVNGQVGAWECMANYMWVLLQRP